MDAHLQTNLKSYSRKGDDYEKRTLGSRNGRLACMESDQGIQNKVDTEFTERKVRTSVTPSSNTGLVTDERNGEASPVGICKKRRGRPLKATQSVGKSEPPPLMVNHREKRKCSNKFSTFLKVLKGEKEFYIEDEGVEENQSKRKRKGRRRKVSGGDYAQSEQSREDGFENPCVIQVTDIELTKEKERIDLEEAIEEILGIDVNSSQSMIPVMGSLVCNSNRGGQDKMEEDLISTIDNMSAEVEEVCHKESQKINANVGMKLEIDRFEQEKEQHGINPDGSVIAWSDVNLHSETPFIEVTGIKEEIGDGVLSVEVTLSHDGSDTLHATINDPAPDPPSVPNVPSNPIENHPTAEKQNGVIEVGGMKRYRCKLCTNIFNSQDDARQHAQECHVMSSADTNINHTNPFKCKDCERFFPTERGRDRHYLHMHRKHQPVQCPECSNTFNSFRPLERHLRNHHDKDATLYCDVCDLEFVLMTSLQSHKEIMHPNVPSKTRVVKVVKSISKKERELEKLNRVFKCSLCGEELVGIRSFRNHHHKKHNGSEYKCSYCNYKHICFSSLNRHMAKVHKAYDMKLYSCQTCPDSYSVPEDLEEHYICMHNVDPKLLCQHCGDKFACMEMLRFHRMSHRAFSCQLCHLGFMKEEALEDHMTAVHRCDPVRGSDNKSLTVQLKNKDVKIDTKDTKKANKKKDSDAADPKVLVITSDGKVEVKQELEKESVEPCEDVTLHLQQTREGGLEEMNVLNPLQGQRVKDLPKKMSCPVCNKVLTTKFLRTHMLSHKGELPHKCRLCDKAYAQGTLLRKHMKNRHYQEFLKLGNKNPKKQKVACDFCQEIYNDIYVLEEHLWKHMDMKPFECSDCKIKFGMESNLREHYKSHYFKEAKPCPVCQREFKSIGYYNDHVEKCQKRWKCEQCGLECDTQEYYRRHQRSEHGGENVVRYQCSYCEKSFVERHRYDDHLITHSSEKSFICHICFKQFKRQRPLNDHLLRTHSTGLFVCSHCNKPFQNEQDLEIHKLKHKKDKLKHKKEFPCLSCNVIFSSNETLLNHLNLNHHSESSHFCHVCDQSFTKQIDLKNHLVTHNASTPHICQVDKCHKMFKSEASLRTHTARRHQGIQYDCPVCEQKFSLESDQIRHAATHSNETSWTCEECASTFRSEALLEKHLVTHTLEKPYECGVCQHVTATRVQVIRHIQSEHNINDVHSYIAVNRWWCSFCGKMFVVKSSIMRHLRDHAARGVDAQGHYVKTRLTQSSNITSIYPATDTASFLEQMSSLSWHDLTKLLRFQFLSDTENDMGERETITTDVWQCPWCLHATQVEDDMRDHLVGSSECQEAVILQLAGGLINNEDTEDNDTGEEQLAESEGSEAVFQLASTDGGLQYVIMSGEENEDVTSSQRHSSTTKETLSEQGEMQVLVNMDESLQQLLHQETSNPNIQIIVENAAPLKRFLVENGNDGGSVTTTIATPQSDSCNENTIGDAAAAATTSAGDTCLLDGSEVLLQTVDGRLVLQQIDVTQYHLVQEGVPTNAIEDVTPTLLPHHADTLEEEFILPN